MNTTEASSRTWVQRALDLVLGVERKVRLRVSLALMAIYGYTLASVLLWYAMSIRVVDPDHGQYLMAFLWVGIVGFYTLVRTNLSTRLGYPGMDLPQCLYALVAIFWAYVIADPLRDAIPMLIALVLVFGMFALKARQVIILGILAALGLGIVMAAMVLHQPEHFDVRLQLLRFALTAGTFPALSGVAYYISQVRARLMEQRTELAKALALLQEVASRDDLTHLVNRRHMQQCIENEAAMQVRTGESFCLALIDLDHFKRVNDVHGHAKGDQVLKEFAAAALAVLRTTDVLSRWGGEEFLLMLPNETPEGAHIALQRIADRMKSQVHQPDHSGLLVTFSCGLTNHPLGEPLHETLERADKALYDAKAQGRNRTVFAPSPCVAP